MTLATGHATRQPSSLAS